MLIPKLFLGLASSAGIGGLVSIFTLSTGGGDPTIWKVDSSNSPFPLFSCSNYNSQILISLKFEETPLTPPTNGKKIKFHGIEKNTGEEVSLYSSSSGAGSTQPYKLTVFQGKNGNGKLTTDDTQINKKYGTDLWCYPTAFKVTSDTSNTSNNSPKKFESISLTLESCGKKGEGQKQECSIKIEGSSGLSWRDDFNPKVII